MENRNDVLDIIYRTHTDRKEAIMVMENILAAIDRDDVWEKIDASIDFFHAHIIEHFGNEEIFIGILRNDSTLLPAERTLLETILNEHKKMLAKLNVLITLKGAVHAQATKDKFFEIANDLIEDITSHASKEDEKLFPLARRKLDSRQLDEIMRTINSANPPA